MTPSRREWQSLRGMSKRVATWLAPVMLHHTYHLLRESAILCDPWGPAGSLMATSNREASAAARQQLGGTTSGASISLKAHSRTLTTDNDNGIMSPMSMYWLVMSLLAIALWKHRVACVRSARSSQNPLLAAAADAVASREYDILSLEVEHNVQRLSHDFLEQAQIIVQNAEVERENRLYRIERGDEAAVRSKRMSRAKALGPPAAMLMAHPMLDGQLVGNCIRGAVNVLLCTPYSLPLGVVRDILVFFRCYADLLRIVIAQAQLLDPSDAAVALLPAGVQRVFEREQPLWKPLRRAEFLSGLPYSQDVQTGGPSKASAGPDSNGVGPSNVDPLDRRTGFVSAAGSKEAAAAVSGVVDPHAARSEWSASGVVVSAAAFAVGKGGNRAVSGWHGPYECRHTERSWHSWRCRRFNHGC